MKARASQTNSKVIVNQNQNKKSKQVSFKELDHDIKQARLTKKLGHWNSKDDKRLTSEKDTCFRTFLNGGVKATNKMKPLLYECYHRMNNKNYKRALQGKITFLNASKKASKVIQKINGNGISRDDLVAILTKFYRFFHIINAHYTVDELYIFDNSKHIYVPVANKLDNLCYALYSGFGYGLLKLHAIIKLIENNKYTKLLDIDSQKYHQFLQKRKNWIVCNNCIFNRLNGKTMKLSPNYFITSKLSTNYVKDDTFAKIANTSIRKAIHYSKRDVNLYGNSLLLDKSISQYIDTWLNGEADGDKGMVRQLMQEMLDALEPYYCHESLVLNFGKTHTGKSNFFIPLKTMLGQSQYASMSIDQLDKPKVLSTLIGKSVILGDDLRANLHIKNGTNLTKVVRGGNVYVEAKYKQGHSVTFCVAILQNTNTLPKTAGKGDWIINRITIVHFKHHYTKKDPLYLNDDVMKRILSNPLICEYLLNRVLHQPAFSRYLQTPESLRLRKVFAYQNNPIQLFVSKIMASHKNRLVKHVLYQQYIQFAIKNGYNSNISFTRFDTLFRECVSDVKLHQERMNGIQAYNQDLITNQFNLKTRKVNANGKPYDKPLVDDIIPGKRYPCYVFPNIPKNIMDVNIDGTVFSILPDDKIKFLPITDFKATAGINEYDTDAKVLHQHNLLKSKDGTLLMQFILDVSNHGYKHAFKDYGLNPKSSKQYIRILKVSAYTRYAHSSFVEYMKEHNISLTTDLQYRLHRENIIEKHNKDEEYSNFSDDKLNDELKHDISNAKQANKAHKDTDIKGYMPLRPGVYSSNNGSYIVDMQKLDWDIINEADISKLKSGKHYMKSISVDKNKDNIVGTTENNVKLIFSTKNKSTMDYSTFTGISNEIKSMYSAVTNNLGSKHNE